MNDTKIPIIAVVGPTASGKTSLAISIAKHIGAEVVSCDSMQIYKELCIASAKPTPDEMQEVPHHMIDVVSPKENFSVSDYENMALPIVEELLSRGKTPIICGGTGFYINSLLYKTFNYNSSTCNFHHSPFYCKIAPLSVRKLRLLSSFALQNSRLIIEV